jgi:hypothetical protein
MIDILLSTRCVDRSRSAFDKLIPFKVYITYYTYVLQVCITCYRYVAYYRYIHITDIYP